MNSSGEAGHVVLVCESQTVGSAAVIRSLGIAGYRVVACSSSKEAIGFKSRYIKSALICPDYESGSAFRSWLENVIETEDVRCIIPSEGFLLAVRPYFDDVAHLLPIGKTKADVYRGMSKFDLFETFSALTTDSRTREHLPPFKMIERPMNVDIDALGLTFPVYVKTDGAYSSHGRSGGVEVASSATELRSLCERADSEFSKYLLQGHVAGVGVGVFVLRWDDEVYASFMHRRLHEVPHTGGVSSLRESWWHEAIYADALRRLEALDWRGVGMFEYRWNQKTDEFALLEFNGRFWGSLHLALYAGVDFPALLVDAFFGCPRRAGPPELGVRCRLTFPKEIQYVMSCLRDRQISLAKKMAVVAEFFWLSIDPRVRSDMLYGGDFGLYIPMMFRSIRSLFRPSR